MPIQTPKTEDKSGRLALLICLQEGQIFNIYEQAILHHLILHSGAPEWGYFATYQSIAAYSQMSRSKALRVIASLEEKGYLLCETRSNKGNNYTINASRIISESPVPVESTLNSIPSEEAEECVTAIEDWLKEETHHPNFEDKSYNLPFLHRVLHDCLKKADSVDHCEQLFVSLPVHYPNVFNKMAGSQNLAAYIRKSFPGWVIKYPYVPPKKDLESTPEEDSND